MAADRSAATAVGRRGAGSRVKFVTKFKQLRKKQICLVAVRLYRYGDWVGGRKPDICERRPSAPVHPGGNKTAEECSETIEAAGGEIQRPCHFSQRTAGTTSSSATRSETERSRPEA